MVGVDHCAVDHLQGVRDRFTFIQGVHDPFPEIRLGPAPKLSFEACPLAELVR